MGRAISKRYGYARISTDSQNELRQIEELKEAGVLEENIFIDKQSGKDFSRPAYQQMIQSLQSGDEVVFSSIDRFGRNYTEMIREWFRILDDRKCGVRVLDTPILNIPNRKSLSLERRLAADITFQALAYVAEKERSIIKRRQKSGIESAKARGVKFGRTKIERPENFEEVYRRVLTKEITNKQAMSELGLKTNTYYAFVNEYKETLEEILSKGTII